MNRESRDTQKIEAQMEFEWKAWTLVGLGLASTLLVVWLVNGFVAYPTPDNLATRWDHYRYIAISRHPFSSTDPLVREAPYCWRILTPLLVYLSPLNWRWSFMLLTIIGLGGAALTLFYYLRRDNSYQIAVLGLVLFFSLSGLMFNLRDYYLSDPLALFAIALGFYWLASYKPLQSEPRQHAAIRLTGQLLPLLLIGVLAKETILALLPLILLKRGLAWRFKLLLCIAPVLDVAIFRLVFPAFNNYSYINEASDVLTHQFFEAGLIGLLMRFNFAFLGTWGPALVLLFYRPRDTLAYLAERKAELIFLIIVYLQLVIAHNVDRLLVYGFMVIVPLLVHKAALLSQERKLNFYLLSGVLLALQLAYFYGRPPLWLSLLVCGFLTIWLLRAVVSGRHYIDLAEARPTKS